MDNYEKVKKIVYRRTKDLDAFQTKPILKSLDFKGIDNYKECLELMKTKDLISYNLSDYDIDYSSVRLTKKGQVDAQII